MIFSEQNLKKAYKDLLANPTLEYSDWKDRNFLGKDIDVEQIRTIVDLWNSLPKLPTVRKMDANVRKEVAVGIQTYGLDECIEAVEHYSEILNADYFLNYIWNIRTFFKQSNALPEFLSDGSKWLNYVRDTGKEADSGKMHPWSSLSLNRQKEIKDEVDETLKLFRKKFWPLITVTNPNLNADEYESERDNAYKNAAIKAFPIIFSCIAHKNGAYLDNPLPVPGTSLTFHTLFNALIVLKHGQVSSKHNFKEEFDKYGLNEKIKHII